MKNIKSQIRILLATAAFLLLTGCGVNWHVATINHDPIYGSYDENYITIAEDVPVDTLNYREFRWKLRTDFNFRWDYANYMMNQPLSFYYRNYPGYLGNAHNFWWNSHQYWTDWAFNYPFTSFNSWYWDRWNPWPRWNRWNSWWGYGGGWYANTWNNHWYQYGYSGWYGHNSLMWGNVWRNDNTYVHINGRRGSRFADGNSNIQNNINNRRNDNNNSNSRVRRYFNPDQNGVIIRNGNDVRVIKPRVYDNPNNVPNNVIRPRNNNNNNNIRVNPNQNWNNNNNSRGINSNRNYYTPPNNNNNNIRSSSPPVINRGSSNISRGSSSSGGSSRGGRGNN